MVDEESITIVHEGDRIELHGRHSSALLLAHQTDGEITTTEAREAAPVELPHAEQGSRIFQHLADHGLMEIWQPEERVDDRTIPPAKRAHLTRRGRELVEQNQLKLETMQPLNQEAEVVRQMLAEHRDAVRDDLGELEDCIDAVEEQVADARCESIGRIDDLEGRVKELEARVDGLSTARTRLGERVSSLESKVSRLSDFVEEQGKSLKRLRRRL